MLAITLMCINGLLFMCVNIALMINAYSLSKSTKSFYELAHGVSVSCFLANGTISFFFYLISFIGMNGHCQTITVCELYDVFFQIQSNRSTYLWFCLFACALVVFHTVALTRHQKNLA